jgi:hypothetical protein
MKQDGVYRMLTFDGIPADEFYEKNATDLDFYLNGDYELMSSETDSNNHFNEQNNKELDSLDNEDLKIYLFKIQTK